MLAEPTVGGLAVTVVAAFLRAQSSCTCIIVRQLKMGVEAQLPALLQCWGSLDANM